MNKRTKDLIHALEFIAENSTAVTDWVWETQRQEHHYEAAAARKALKILDSLRKRAVKLRRKYEHDI